MIGRLSETELEEWSEEGNHVQWFRAEAEMQRWQEQWEMKQAEFLPCIRSFNAMCTVCTNLAELNSRPGHVAYALQKAAMYSKMAYTTQDLLRRTGHGHLLNLTSSLACLGLILFTWFSPFI